MVLVVWSVPRPWFMESVRWDLWISMAHIASRLRVLRCSEVLSSSSRHASAVMALLATLSWTLFASCWCILYAPWHLRVEVNGVKLKSCKGFLEEDMCLTPWLSSKCRDWFRLGWEVYFIEDVLPDYQWDVHAVCTAWQNAISRSKWRRENGGVHARPPRSFRQEVSHRWNSSGEQHRRRRTAHLGRCLAILPTAGCDWGAAKKGGLHPKVETQLFCQTYISISWKLKSIKHIQTWQPHTELHTHTYALRAALIKAWLSVSESFRHLRRFVGFDTSTTIQTFLTRVPLRCER